MFVFTDRKYIIFRKKHLHFKFVVTVPNKLGYKYKLDRKL